MRETNEAGIALVKKHEGCSLEAYRDPRGIPTIGYGHTLGVRMGDVWTQQQADDALQEDVDRASNPADQATDDVSTSDNQFAAMVSLAFNIGDAAFLSSTVLRLHRAGDYQGAADAFLVWDKAHIDGKLVEIPGLLARRADERALYLS